MAGIGSGASRGRGGEEEIPSVIQTKGDYLHHVRTAQRVGTNHGEKVIPWFLGDSMLTYCPHSEAEMTVAGTPLPFDWI